MVDGISFNPFTQKAFTPEEIEKLDSNKDGVISMEEFDSGVKWLGGQKDTDVEIQTNDPGSANNAEKIFKGAKENGVKDTAQNQDELKNYMEIIKDEYLEQYFQSNPKLSVEEKTTMLSLIGKLSAEFLTKLIEKNPKGPFDMKEITAEFTKSIEKSINDRKTGLESVNKEVEDLKNTDGKFDKLAELTKNASADYVTGSEYNKIMQETVKYLMGELLNGADMGSFLKDLNGSYQSNANYKKALAAIKTLQSSKDPEAMQKALADASEALTAFVNSAGKDNLVNSISNKQQSKVESEMEAILGKLADAYIEKALADNPKMSAEEVAAFTKLVKGSIGTFMAQAAEKNEDLTKMDPTNLAENFAAFINSKRADLIKTKAAMNQLAGEMTNSYNALVSTTDRASKDKFISADEKASIVKAGTDFVLSQMMNGLDTISLLNSINSNYKNVAEYQQAAQLVKNMKNETDPAKLDEMFKKAQGLITKLLDSCSGEKLVSGVNGLKPTEISDSQKTDIMNGSSVSSDYQANVSRSSGYGKQNDESLGEIQAMAKKDLEAIAESMKAQLKKDLGSSYNEADVARYINDAINDTLASFTQSASRRKGGGDGSYNTGSDENAFVFLRRSGTKKGRYTYNLQALSNTFIEKFNETSAKKHAAKLDPSLATYDVENVIAASLGNDYNRNKTETVEGRNDDQNAYSELIERAKTELKSVAAALRASMIAEGVPLSLSEIDSFIDDCINDTITDMKNAFQYCQPGGSVAGGLAKSIGGGGLGGIAAGAGLAAGVGAVSSAAAAAGALGVSTASVLAGGGAAVASGASAGLGAFGLAGAFGAAGPVGWAAAGVIALGASLKSFTNLFGATYGQHNADAGFFFERKSNSKDGKWGYDTKTLVDTFLAKIDQKVQEAKEKKKVQNGTEAA